MMNFIRRITDLILYFTFCIMAGTGVMLQNSFVKGMGPQTVFGLSKPDWVLVHFWVGVLMLAALLVHLILNRAWIKKIGAQGKGWLAVLVIVLGVAIAAIFAVWPTNIETSDNFAGRGMGYGGAQAHGKANFQHHSN